MLTQGFKLYRQAGSMGPRSARVKRKGETRAGFSQRGKKKKKKKHAGNSKGKRPDERRRPTELRGHTMGQKRSERVRTMCKYFKEEGKMVGNQGGEAAKAHQPGPGGPNGEYQRLELRPKPH